jgi:DNA-binding NarL/FixJ family response regulator
MRKTRVLLADDHQIVLEGLKNLLEQEFELVGMVVDGKALVNEALKLHPDVIVVDISMPLLNGNEAMKGRTYVTPRIAGELMQTYKKTRPGDKIFEKKLTHRQGEILQLLAEGHSAKEIANMLSISPRKVETHKYNMMERLNLKTTADLIKFAIKHGFTAI